MIVQRILRFVNFQCNKLFLSFSLSFCLKNDYFGNFELTSLWALSIDALTLIDAILNSAFSCVFSWHMFSRTHSDTKCFFNT